MPSPAIFTKDIYSIKENGAPGEIDSGLRPSPFGRTSCVCRHAPRSSVRTPDRAIEANVAIDEMASQTTRFEVRSLNCNLLLLKKACWGVRCHIRRTMHNRASLNHAKIPQ